MRHQKRTQTWDKIAFKHQKHITQKAEKNSRKDTLILFLSFQNYAVCEVNAQRNHQSGLKNVFCDSPIGSQRIGNEVAKENEKKENCKFFHDSDFESKCSTIFSLQRIERILKSIFAL